MIKYVVETAVRVAGKNVIVIIGHQAEEVKKTISEEANVTFAIQNEQKGTGHAVQCALPVIPKSCNDVVILSGDVPLIKSSTIQRLIENHRKNQNDVTLLAAKLDNPFGYGRILLKLSGGFERIVEETDATDAEKSINIINSGIYCVKKNFLEYSLSQIKPNNSQQEFYLTDIIEIAFKSGKKTGLLLGKDPTEILGINTPKDLRRVESLLIEPCGNHL